METSNIIYIKGSQGIDGTDGSHGIIAGEAGIDAG
jgi:hypothetical protein